MQMTDLQEKRFNRIFNIFILAGMICVTLVVNIFKMQEPGADILKMVIVTVGAIMGVFNCVLSANGMIWNFIFGVVNVSICAYTNFDSGNMGQFLLHVLYFLPMQFVGIWQWHKRGAKGGDAPAVRRLKAGQWGIVATSILVGIVLVYGLLYYIDVARGATIEHGKIALDSTVMVLNITGQVLLSLAFADSWFIWILVNIFSIALWTNRALASGSGSYAPVMITKYVFFFFNSLNGLRLWLKFDRKQRQ